MTGKANSPSRSIRGLELDDVPVGDLFPFDGNPRTISEDAIDRIAKSIREFGFVQPVVAWRDPSDGRLKIVIGHQRYRAAVKMGLERVPTAIRSLTRAQAVALNIADNRLGELSTWDFPKLKDLLESIDTGEIDLSLSGFSEVEIGGLMDWTPPLPPKPPADPAPEIAGRTAAESPFLVLLFPTEEARAAFASRVGAGPDSRSVDWARLEPLLLPVSEEPR